MKKIAVLISFLLIVVGATAQAVAEEKSFFGTWHIPWTDGLAKIQIKDGSSTPGTVIVTYYWGQSENGICTQAKIDNSTLRFELRGNEGKMTVILRTSEDTLTGEKYSTTRLQRVAE